MDLVCQTVVRQSDRFSWDKLRKISSESAEFAGDDINENADENGDGAEQEMARRFVLGVKAAGRDKAVQEAGKETWQKMTLTQRCKAIRKE